MNACLLFTETGPALPALPAPDGGHANVQLCVEVSEPACTSVLGLWSCSQGRIDDGIFRDAAKSTWSDMDMDMDMDMNMDMAAVVVQWLSGREGVEPRVPGYLSALAPRCTSGGGGVCVLSAVQLKSGGVC